MIKKLGMVEKLSSTSTPHIQTREALSYQKRKRSAESKKIHEIYTQLKLYTCQKCNVSCEGAIKSTHTQTHTHTYRYTHIHTL